ncbi:MAG: MerR family transcriptional regulator [Acidimicrobiia bacterium]|nr:MerR family transcriptional regulator [Acidimicrobiia bacterium]MDX2468365.1 MerR family transcriptional regulator [Acidimicrobiia bacterium]
MNDVLTVGAVSRLAGVTVRTLHHYDELGLVVPAGRSDSGYRTYGPAEVERLQEVLFFRELGFPLDQIKSMMENRTYTRISALQQQRQLLEQQTERLLTMIDAVDRAVLAERTGLKMSSEEILEGFGDFDPKEHEEEAKQRWGESDAYKQSAQRTARYTKQDWENIKSEADAINQKFLALMAEGAPATDPAALAVAEEHRAHITRWFYDCSIEIHEGLGQMYVADERFRNNINKAGEGFAEYMSAAIAVNATQVR